MRRAKDAIVSESIFDVITTGDVRQLEVVLNALRDFNMNAAGPQGHPPLHHAVHGTVNTCELVRYLVERRGAALNTLNTDGETPLIIAVSADREDVVRLLLELGADVDVPSRTGAVPLYYALTKRSCRAVLMLLLMRRPNVNFLTEDTENILHAAVRFGDAGFVDAILNGLRVYRDGRLELPPLIGEGTATLAPFITTPHNKNQGHQTPSSPSSVSSAKTDTVASTPNNNNKSRSKISSPSPRQGNDYDSNNNNYTVDDNDDDDDNSDDENNTDGKSSSYNNSSNNNSDRKSDKRRKRQQQGDEEEEKEETERRQQEHQRTLMMKQSQTVALFKKWTQTSSLMDSRSSSSQNCPIGIAVHTALNTSNSTTVRQRSAEVAMLLSSVRTDMLLEIHLGIPRDSAHSLD